MQRLRGESTRSCFKVYPREKTYKGRKETKKDPWEDKNSKERRLNIGFAKWQKEKTNTSEHSKYR